MAINNNNDNLDKKIDKLINAMELLVDAVERGKGDSGYMSGSRFARRIKDGGNDYLYEKWEKLSNDEIKNFKDNIINSLKKQVKDLNKELKDVYKDLNDPSISEKRKKKLDKHKESLKRKRDNARKKLNSIDDKYIKNEYEQEYNPVSNRQLKKQWNAIKDSEEGRNYRSFSDFKKSKKESANYHQISNERDEARRRLANSGLGNTAFGRYGQKMFDRQQRAADLGNFANYLGHGGAKKLGYGMFGKGKAGEAVVAGLGKFSKGLGFASKLLGGPWVQAILIAIDALKMIGDAVGDWKKYTAEMTKFQMQEEQLQYENSKRIATIATESAVEDVKYNGDIQLKMMDVQSQNLMDAVALSNDQYVTAVQTALGPMMQGINASAYQAAESRISAAAQYQKNLNVKELREESFGRYEKMRGSEYRAAKASLAAEENIANVEYTTKSAENALKQEQYRGQHAWQSIVRSNDARQTGATVTQGGNALQSDINGTPGSTRNPVTGREYGNVGRYDNNGIGTDITNALRNTLSDNLREGVQAEAMATLEYANQSLRNQADWQKTDIENRYKLTNTELQYATDIADKQQEVSVEVRNKFIEAAEAVEKTWLKLAQQNEQFLDKLDAVTNNTGLSMGLTNQGQLHYFQKMLMTQTIDVASKYGKNAEDVSRAQQSYIETTGRNKTLGKHDYGQLFGLGTYLGDDTLAAGFGSEMEIFNHGIAESVDMLDDVLKDVNKIGLNGRKYTKDLVNNLKLAQKYNFRGGTKELMQMAKWAQQTRFNLGSLSGMIDKVQEGGLEGTITQAAGFQVLGGQAAINSDPLGMMFDAWADPQAYAKRMQDMTKGFGRFNSKTGETEFNINESMQIAQMAKLQGRSPEELRQEIMQRNKATQVERQLGAYNSFDQDQKAMITNKAEFKDGRWVVKMKGGETKDISQLSKEDLSELIPIDHNERMEDYMEDVVTALNKLTGEETREKTILAKETLDEYYKAYEERHKKAFEAFAQNRDEYITNTKKGMDDATAAFQDYIKIFEDGNQNVDAARAKIDAQANSIADALSNTALIINEANQRLGLSSGGSRVTSPVAPTTSTINTLNKPATPHTHVKNNIKTDNVVTDWNSFMSPAYDFPIHYGMTSSIPVSKPAGSNISRTIVHRGAYDGNVDELTDGVMSAMGKPMLVSAKQITPISDGAANFPIHDGMTSGGGMPMFVSAKQVTPVRDGAANFPIHDGMTSGGGMPMFVSAKQVTPVRDGAAKMAKTDARDTALFAKNGGPFDKLFSGVLSRVNTIYEEVVDPMSVYGSTSNGNDSPSNISLNINGKLELTGENGQSINIIEELKRNPMFVRQITEMIVLQMNNNTHGGRNELFHNRFSG